MRTRKRQIAIAIAMLMLTVPTLTLACGCPSFGSGTDKQYAESLLLTSGAAFYGKVVGVTEEPRGRYLTRFKISRSWGYRLEELVEVISDIATDGSCAVNFGMDEEYLLFPTFSSRSQASAMSCDVQAKALSRSMGVGFKPKKSTAK